MAPRSGTELLIVDNSDQDWKVRAYLHDWCQLAEALDIATGYLEIGALLALDGEWQKVDQIRILMGDEVSRRTRGAFTEALQGIAARLDDSLEAEKDANDFLRGVPAVVDALRAGKIRCRVYRKQKFHAKTYITHARQAVVGAFALVGSSNFTYPGLMQNIELNVQLTGAQVGLLQEWYERHWDEAEDVTPEILRTIERHTREYTPFEVYTRALQEYFEGYQLSPTEWEQTASRMYPVLDRYQQDGYQRMLHIANTHGGAFLCDGVGLGKTFVGLMLIERLVVHDRKRVVLFAPKTARADVWERDLHRYLPHVGGISGGDFSNLVIFNHTDLGRGRDFPYRFERAKELADVIIIDEAHHFRNPGTAGTQTGRPSRYRLLYDLLDGPGGPKQVFMLTATPINNRLDDFRHMTELFSRREEDGGGNYFASLLGIHSLRAHFVRMERELRAATEPEAGDDEPRETNLSEAERTLSADVLFNALVVQRSRAYVKQSQLQQGASPACFPTRETPRVAEYSVKRTYGRLLESVERAFSKDKPLFVLGIYYPLAYYKGPSADVDPLTENRQKQVVSLIRTQFLKRFQSSANAFERSCEHLLLKLLAWATRHSETAGERRRLERWQQQHADLVGYVQQHQLTLDQEQEAEEDLITEEMLQDVEHLSRDEYDVEEILADTLLDLDQVAEFLDELRRFKPAHDDKLKALVKLLKADPVLRTDKVLIFSEFADTARYLRDQLIAAGIEGVEEIDSTSARDRSDVIHRFAPYYNGLSSAELAAQGKDEIRVLISTDVLSEGLNLQDATRVINYDLHWNPVRLMQRIGRVDRRLNPEVEARLVADHPDRAHLRGTVVYWNFLPPDELEDLLNLYRRVSHKTLRISRTLGIEGRQLLKPDDDYEALREFNEAYEGTTTPVEEMHLEYQQLLQEHPDLEARLRGFPRRIFSGKQHPSPDARGVFLCYRIPKPAYSATPEGERPWTEEAGETRWCLYDLATERIIEEAAAINEVIRATPETPRRCIMEPATLADIRRKVDRHLTHTRLRALQAPVGVKPILKAWMELS